MSAKSMKVGFEIEEKTYEVEIYKQDDKDQIRITCASDYGFSAQLNNWSELEENINRAICSWYSI